MGAKHIIYEDKVFDYLEGSINGESRRAIERDAYTSGELHDLYQMQNNIYESHLTQAEDLLGRDITSSEEMQNVFNEANLLRAKKPAELSISDYLESLIQDRLSISRTESERLYEQIVGGVEIFYSSYEHQVEVDDVSFITSIEHVMDDLSNDEKMDYLINVYLILLTFNGKINKDSIESIKEQIKYSPTEVNGNKDNIDALLNRIKLELGEATLPGNIITEDTLRRLKDDFSITPLLDSWRLDKELAIYSAVCAYIAQSKGEVNLIDNAQTEKGINPVSIGIGVASGIKQSELTRQFIGGEISEGQFAKCIKIAACVVAFALAAYLAIHFAGPVIGEVLQHLAIDPTLGFWWNALNVAMFTAFFASFALNVLLQGAFISVIVGLIIDVVYDWISTKQKHTTQVVNKTASNNQTPTDINGNNEVATQITERIEQPVCHGPSTIKL